MREQIEAKHLRLLAIDAVNAALEAGMVVMDLYQATTEIEVNLKADASPLTEADKKADEIIRDLLLHTFIPLLSEEGRVVNYGERRDWGYYWLVDPLDGTKEFIQTNGEFTINIALVGDGEPVIGVVFVPVDQKLYYAVRGEGAFCAEKICAGRIRGELTWEGLRARSKQLPLVDRDTDDPAQGLIVVGSRSHIASETEAYVDALREQYSDVKFIACGSSLKMCMVAEGTADLYPRVAPTSEWDTAAGQAVVEMAGMEVVDFAHFGRLEYNKESMINPPFVVRRKRLKIPKFS